MKLIKYKLFLLSIVVIMVSCNDSNSASGNRAVMQASSRDDYYQLRGYVNHIPNDSIRELVRQDSIRIANSKHHNK